jgi:predicted nucleotidyltransferase
MSRPHSPSFGAKQRSRIARRAATARWSRQGRGILTLAEIRDAVAKALGEREAKTSGKRKPKAYLFDSYARGDATAADDIYILVIEETPSQDWPTETGKIREALYDLLGHEKGIHLYLADKTTFEEWKGAYGTPYYAAAREGVRLV